MIKCKKIVISIAAILFIGTTNADILIYKIKIKGSEGFKYAPRLCQSAGSTPDLIEKNKTKSFCETVMDATTVKQGLVCKAPAIFSFGYVTVGGVRSGNGGFQEGQFHGYAVCEPALSEVPNDLDLQKAIIDLCKKSSKCITTLARAPLTTGYRDSFHVFSGYISSGYVETTDGYTSIMADKKYVCEGDINDAKENGKRWIVKLNEGCRQAFPDGQVDYWQQQKTAD